MGVPNMSVCGCLWIFVEYHACSFTDFYYCTASQLSLRPFVCVYVCVCPYCSEYVSVRVSVGVCGGVSVGVSGVSSMSVMTLFDTPLCVSMCVLTVLGIIHTRVCWCAGVGGCLWCVEYVTVRVSEGVEYVSVRVSEGICVVSSMSLCWCRRVSMVCRVCQCAGVGGCLWCMMTILSRI